MHISYISDLHLDFYIHMTSDWHVKTRAFLETLLPKTELEVLVIAGDLSHYNAQSNLALQFFSQHYEHVFFVMGNHDYYLVSRNHETKYKHNSLNRELELKQAIATLPNVTLLEHYEAHTFKGIKFAGATNWYGLHTTEEQQFFQSKSNDSQLIKRLLILNKHSLEMAAYEKLEPVDVLITHVPPIHMDFYESTECLFNPLQATIAKVFIFGHCHAQQIYKQDHAIYCINALGYPESSYHKKSVLSA